MMLIPDERVAQVVRLLSETPGGLDSLDIAELMTGLEEDFGVETVWLALRFIEASRAHRSRGTRASPFGAVDPLWDRELDS